MINICNHVSAEMNRSRFIEAANARKESSKASLALGSVSSKQKILSCEIPLIWPATRTQALTGFFISAVMDTIDNGLESDSFHGKTGHTQPRYARLANLVKVLHNLSMAKRQKALVRNRINSSCALGLVNQMEKWTRGYMFSCPFDSLLFKDNHAKNN